MLDGVLGKAMILMAGFLHCRHERRLSTGQTQLRPEQARSVVHGSKCKYMPMTHIF